MPVCYDKLRRMLKKQKISDSAFYRMTHMTSYEREMLDHDELLPPITLSGICLALNCGLQDILEYIPDPNISPTSSAGEAELQKKLKELLVEE